MSDDKHTQDGAGKLSSGEDTLSVNKIPTPEDSADPDDGPQGEEHDNLEEVLQDATLDLEDQQQQHLQQQDQQQPQKLVADEQQLPNQDPESEEQDDAAAEGGDGDDQDRDNGSDNDNEPDPATLPPPAAVESDDDMAGTKIGIPKFTGQMSATKLRTG